MPSAERLDSEVPNLGILGHSLVQLATKILYLGGLSVDFPILFSLGFSQHSLLLRLSLCRCCCDGFHRCLSRRVLASSKNSCQLIVKLGEGNLRHLLEQSLCYGRIIAVTKLTCIPLFQGSIQIMLEIRLPADDLSGKSLQFISESFFRLFCLLAMAVEFC